MEPLYSKVNLGKWDPTILELYLDILGLTVSWMLSWCYNCQSHFHGSV